MARSYQQICPIAQTLDIIGERWTVLIVRELVFGRTKFSEFQEALPGVPARVLSDRLKKLGAGGIVERSVYSEHPLRAEYRLTSKGESLKPVLGALASWGMDQCLTPAQQQIIRDHVPDDVFA